MWLGEQILFELCCLLRNTEIAHSYEMKQARKNVDAFSSYRAKEIDRIIQAAKRYGVPISERTILDFGCNDGVISAGYLRKGAKCVVGVDIDGQAICRARKLHRDERLIFIQNSSDTIPLRKESIEVVVSYDTFEHLARPQAILSEFHRILIPGGKALIGTWGWWHPFAPHLWGVMPVPWAHVFFSEKTLLRVCRRVYLSCWYVPNFHDFDEYGHRIQQKYTSTEISTEYLNKYLIRDFERAFRSSGFGYETHLIPFGSCKARWTRLFLVLPWIREFLAGYVWFVLTKPANHRAK